MMTVCMSGGNASVNHPNSFLIKAPELSIILSLFFLTDFLLRIGSCVN
jgi:hypothetical protein